MNLNYNYKEPFKRTDYLNDAARATATTGTSSYSSTDQQDDENQGCFCCDSDEDSIDKVRFQHAKGKCMQKCFRICLLSCLIIGYTFVGAVIFLATEDSTMAPIVTNGDASSQPSSSFAVTEKLSPSPNESTVQWLTKLSAENRAKTVQNIWDITVNLNILYRDNWTRLASEELNSFQERLLEILWQEKSLDGPVYSQDTQRLPDNSPTHWKLGKAFLYSISILATIGYGNSVSRSLTVKIITMVYTALGLPVMFMYLSSMGSLLSTCAQHVFSRTLCCCLCSKCGYCCYDEKLMEEKERRMKRKRQMKEEYQRRKQMNSSEPFFVSGCSSLEQMELERFQQPDSWPNRNKNDKRSTISLLDSLRAATNAKSDEQQEDEYSRFLAPLFVCLTFTCLYVLLGSLVLYKFDEDWTFLDSVYFCFMLVSTIGLTDSMPSSSVLAPHAQYNTNVYGVLLVWFFSAYIFLGLGFSAMCFKIIHDGVKRKITELYLYSDKKLRSQRRQSRKKATATSSPSDQSNRSSSFASKHTEQSPTGNNAVAVGTGCCSDVIS